MADDTPEDITPPPGSGRAKRPPPTIDLEASEVTSETQGAGEAAGAEPQPEPSAPQRSRSAFSSALIAAVTGALAAALVIAAATLAGWPGEAVAPTAPAAPRSTECAAPVRR